MNSQPSPARPPQWAHWIASLATSHESDAEACAAMLAALFRHGPSGTVQLARRLSVPVGTVARIGKAIRKARPGLLSFDDASSRWAFTGEGRKHVTAWKPKPKPKKTRAPSRVRRSIREGRPEWAHYLTGPEQVAAIVYAVTTDRPVALFVEGIQVSEISDRLPHLAHDTVRKAVQALHRRGVLSRHGTGAYVAYLPADGAVDLYSKAARAGFRSWMLS